jgi:methyl-accepting chemotaxis protein
MRLIARLFDIKNLPIGVKLLRSFGTILVLLIVISAISVVGFRTFRGIAEDNALMGRVQANLLIAQGLVKDFVRTRDDALVAQFDQRFDQLEALAAEAVAAIDQGERAERVSAVAADLADYRRGFSDVVQYTREREQLMATMSERSDRMLYAMHEVMRIAFETNEPVWSYYAGMAQEALLLGRVYTDRFLDANRQQDYDKAMGELTEKLDSIFGMLQQNLQSPEGQAYVTELIDSKVDFLVDLERVYQIILAQNAVIADTLNVLGPKVAEEAEWVKLDIMAQQDSLGNLIGILSVVMSLLGIALALFITRVMTRAIKGPVDELVTLAQAMVRGDLSHKTQIDQRDELGTLARAFTAMQDKLAGLLQTTNNLIESVSHGKLDQRADDSNYEGAYKHLVDGVNELCDSFVKPIHLTADYVDRIARGDIPPRITEEYRGDFNEIKNSLNQAIDVMNSLLAETDHLIVATRNGQLDRRGRPEQFSGDWGKLVRGINELVEAFVRPINVTADYVDRIARGDIPPPITEEYKGDFNAIKNNLNKAVAVMSGLSAEIGKLISAAEQGQLDVRAQAQGFEGSWDDMIRGLNNLVTAFVQPLQLSADYVDRIARGDLPQPIAAQYHGDFNTMKNNLNQLIANLQAFSTALAGIIEAVRRGQLATRADSGALAGTWHQMVDGVNQVLTAFTEPLNEGGEVLAVMATGDLRPRMQGQYQGDFLSFRNNINRLGDSLASLIEQVN